MTRGYNFFSTQSEIEKRNQAQENRQQSGIPGISIFSLKPGERNVVRFLHPFSLGLNLLTHTVVTSGQNGKKLINTYVCDKSFNSDVQSFCPVCQWEFENPDQKISTLRTVKNFLVYNYDKAGKFYQTSDGSTKSHDVINIVRFGPGKDQSIWKDLENINNLFRLSGVDVEIIRIGEGLQTVYNINPLPIPQQPATPGGPVTQSGSVFNYNLLPQDVVQHFPPPVAEPGLLDPTNNNDFNTITAWGDFYIKAGRYKFANEFEPPRFSGVPQQSPPQQFGDPQYQQPPVQGAPTYQQNGGGFGPQQTPYQTAPMTGQPVQPPNMPQQTGVQPNVNPWS